jgi:hypothetical protein
MRRGLFGFAALAAGTLASAGAGGQTSWPEARAELGVRYWMSSGRTSWSHNAQGTDPALGNPTSTLTYSNLDAQIVELHGRLRVGDDWYVKANGGLGRINTGSLRDEDFFAGQITFSDTNSSVKGKGLAYATFDVGRDIWTSRSGRTVYSMFGGAQRWIERADAYGLSGSAQADNTTPAISNEVHWNSLRLGLAGRGQLSGRTRISADLALVPFARFRNEDSHHMRTDPGDLGPVPNVINEGRGRGVQFDFELRRALFEDYDLGFGLRYWRLWMARGTNRGAGQEFPLAEQQTERVGITFSLSRRW